jgi:hypothetical protein
MESLVTRLEAVTDRLEKHEHTLQVGTRLGFVERKGIHFAPSMFGEFLQVHARFQL